MKDETYSEAFERLGLAFNDLKIAILESFPFMKIARFLNKIFGLK